MLNILHTMPMPVSILNGDGTIRHINHATEKYFDITSKNVIGQNCHEIFHPVHLSRDRCPLCLAIVNKKNIDKLELYHSTKEITTQYSLNFISINSQASIVHTSVDMGNINTQAKEMYNFGKRMELAFKGYKAGMYEWNMVDNSAYLSKEWKVMLGYDKNEPFPEHLSTWKDRVHPDDIDIVLQDVQQTLNERTTHIETTHRLKHKDGHWIWILGRGFIQYDKNDNPLSMIGIHTDISKYIALQHKSTERRKILDNSLNEIYIFSAKDFKFLYLNQGAKQNVGYSFREIANLTPSDLNPNMEKEFFHDILKSTTEERDKNTSFFTQCQRKDGSFYDVEVYLQATTFEENKAYVAFVLDITERRKNEVLLQKQAKSLYHLAHYDILTDLANMRLLTDRINQSIKKAIRYRTKLALLFIDINKFKMINDRYGHDVGDKVLKEIAARLKKSAREEDTVARFAGDEFIILLEHAKNVDDLKEKIQSIFQKPIKVDTHSLNITCSIGVSIYPDDATTTEQLLKDADRKMYRDKDNTSSSHSLC